MREMSLWLRMSLYGENYIEEILMLMYKTTWGESFSVIGALEKVIQLGWFETPTNSSPSLLFELGMEWMVIKDSSWIKMISNSNWIFSMVLTNKEFFQTFCKKILKFLIFMKNYCSQMNKLNASCSLTVFDTLLNDIPCWSNDTRKSTDLNLLDGHLYS